MKTKRELHRGIVNNQITEELLKERIEQINKSQNKYRYELTIEENKILEYGLNIKERLGETIVATRGFFDKVELLSHLKGMEEILKFI